MPSKVRKVEVYQGGDGDWYWRARASNGEVVSDSSEGYTSRSYCIDMAEGENEGIPATVVESE
jgi:uncharacterized protein YegP (UPF0339 family)